MNTLIQAILLGVLALVANLDFFTGGTMIARPLVTGVLVGLVMGDVKTGLIVGATLELAFIGSFSIGAALPPDTISGAILGTAFAIKSGSGAEVALTLALPIATLVLFIKNLAHVFLMPYFVNKADAYAAQGNGKAVVTIDMVAGFIYVLVAQMIPVALGFYGGSEVVKHLIDSIPAFVLTGLQVATGILPAFGLALLMKPIINKKVAIFFVIGFCLAGYLKLPITSLAVLGFAMAVVLSGYTLPDSLKLAGTNGVKVNNGVEGIDYDSEEF